MHYLLGDQKFYFPASDDQSYTLEEFLSSNPTSECRLPTIVKISSLNLHGRSLKDILSKNIPLLLLTTDQLQSILAECYCTNDRKYQSNKRRSISTQNKFFSRGLPNYRTMKKLSRSNVTLNTAVLPTDENSDDEGDNLRTIVRSLNENRSTAIPLCRVPLEYHGFFELLNENDRAIEPFHIIRDLCKIDFIDSNDQKTSCETWPKAFYLRSQCTAYTKRYIPYERKLSGSADSSYGSLSDLEQHKNLLILNDDKITLQPGQIIRILNTCVAYRPQTPEIEVDGEQFVSHSSTTAWLLNKSRLFFSRKKKHSSSAKRNPLTSTNATRSMHDISRRHEPYLKCQTEQGDVIYLSMSESGLFSPLNSDDPHIALNNNSENIDVSSVFQLRELIPNFRFPISVRLLHRSIKFDNIYSPASINQYEASYLSSTKFRLLLPYTEHVVYACPLIIPSTCKSQLIVIPIPINSDIEIQRCLNMREIVRNNYYEELIESCKYIMNEYRTEFSYIHFPLVLNTTTRNTTKRKSNLFKKRSQSESHIEYHAFELNKDQSYRKSCDVTNLDDQSDIDNHARLFYSHEQLYHHDSFQRARQKLLNNSLDQQQQSSRRSGNYTKLKNERQRKHSRQQDCDSDDEEYRDLDHIYDYIRSGDLTDDIQRIQAKEQAYNTENNIHGSRQQHNGTTDSMMKTRGGRIEVVRVSAKTMEGPRYPHHMDDSRPLKSELDENESPFNTSYAHSRQNFNDTIDTESRNSKQISKMKRISKHKMQ